jgi:choline dehydrogenase-like flavoprotein
MQLKGTVSKVLATTTQPAAPMPRNSLWGPYVSGRQVIVEVEGRPQSFDADVVVVSCGAANSAKLLLMSANDKHPNGLANGSDQVGRNYMFHNSQTVLAISKEPNPTMFQKTIALNDFYFGMEEFDDPAGNIQMIGKSMGPMYRGEKPVLTALAPMGALDEIAKRAVDFWLSTEDLPSADNRITVDKLGNVTLSYTPNNQVAKQKLFEKLKSMLETWACVAITSYHATLT